MFEQIESGELIEPRQLKKVLKESTKQGAETFSINSSLLDWKIDKQMNILEVEVDDERLTSSLQIDLPSEIDDNRREEVRNRISSRVRDTFLRTGLCEHRNLKGAMKRLRNYDDVILGLDTNVILNCIITSILLNRIYENDFPNWLLLIVPKIAMAEVENKSNRKGYEGRIGQRGIVELLDLNRPDPNLPGISIMTVGKIPQNFESIRKDNWRLDSEIRSQFKDYIKGIEFHKGIFFISQDRVNAMMASAEGIEGIYLQKPSIRDIERVDLTLSEFSTLIYELSVQFGEINIEGRGKPKLILNLQGFWTGKHVADWEASRMRIADLKTS